MLGRRKSLISSYAAKLVSRWPLPTEMENGFPRFHGAILQSLQQKKAATNARNTFAGLLAQISSRFKVSYMSGLVRWRPRALPNDKAENNRGPKFQSLKKCNLSKQNYTSHIIQKSPQKIVASMPIKTGPLMSRYLTRAFQNTLPNKL